MNLRTVTWFYNRQNVDGLLSANFITDRIGIQFIERFIAENEYEIRIEKYKVQLLHLNGEWKLPITFIPELNY